MLLDKRITSITFQNNITHNLAYKFLDLQKKQPKQKLLYLNFEERLIDYFKENKSTSRKDVEKITGMKKSEDLSLLNEFIQKGLMKRRVILFQLDIFGLIKGHFI